MQFSWEKDMADSNDPYDQIFGWIRDMEELVSKRDWAILEKKYHRVCSQYSMKDCAERIKKFSTSTYQKKLTDLFTRATHAALLHKHKQVYFEFDMDNGWGGYLRVGEKQYITLKAPGCSAFGKLYGSTFAGNMSDAARNAYLIARTFATLGRSVDAIDTAGVKFLATFHDGEPITFAEGGAPEFSRISEKARKAELGGDADKRSAEMLKSLAEYLTTEAQRRAVDVIAKLDGRASPYGGNLEKSGGLDYCYLEDTAATDDDVKLLKCFPTLQNITLGNTNITDESLRIIGMIPNLRALFLDNTKITDIGIKYLTTLTKLSTLSIANTAVTKASMKKLAKLTSLTQLDLCGLDISMDERRALRKKIPGLEIFPYEMNDVERAEWLKKLRGG